MPITNPDNQLNNSDSNSSLYRKYKREAITRKILEVEAQLQSTMELEAELDNPDHRPDRRQYESSTSSSESDDSFDRKRRKRRKDRKSKSRKSGKKVRAKSRNKQQDPEYEKAKHKMELMELEAQAKIETVKHSEIEKKQENHRRHYLDSGFPSNTTTTELGVNDKPPTYSR